MTLLGEPLPVQEDDPRGADYYNEWMRGLFSRLQNLQLTCQEGAITDGQKVGNLNAVYSVFTSNAVANTEDTTAHALGRVPLGRIIVSQDKAGSLYRNGTDWTATNIYTKSSAASVAWVIILF